MKTRSEILQELINLDFEIATAEWGPDHLDNENKPFKKSWSALVTFKDGSQDGYRYHGVAGTWHPIEGHYVDCATATGMYDR